MLKLLDLSFSFSIINGDNTPSELGDKTAFDRFLMEINVGL